MSSALKIIAAGLLLLGIIVILIGEKPAQEASGFALTFDEYNSLISAQVPMVSPVELAEYLVQQEHHYNLVDLQKPDAGYHIPTSETHSITSFLDQNIAVNETIFLYSESEAEAVQLYLLLNIRGYFKVKVLAGGSEAWFDQILQPMQYRIDASQLDHRRELTEFFGGSFGLTGNQMEQQLEFPHIMLEKQHKKHQGC